MARYLVTGGCGFIGSHLCAALLRRDHTVLALDDLSTGRMKNLAYGSDFLLGDITNSATVGDAVRDVDGCFHLAAIASVERGVQDWLGTHTVNQTGTVVILDALRRLPNKPPMIYASSAAVYGDCGTLPVAETAEPRPLSAYGADKYGCELHARVAFYVHGLPTVGLRFFNVYGPGQDPRSPYSGVISLFCDRIARGETVDVFGDGLQTRDFVYVGDVVAALMAAMESPPDRASVFNVCTGQPTSVRDLAARIAELCGKRLQMRQCSPRVGEVRHSVGSPERARQHLGIRHAADLPTGLRQLIAFNTAVV